MVFYEHGSRFWQEPVNLFIINCIPWFMYKGKQREQMWARCSVIELLSCLNEKKKRLKEYSALDIDGVDLLSFEELVWKVNHSLCLKRFISLQYHSIISSKVMNLFSNQIDQILILFHNVLLMNFLLMICIILLLLINIT